MSKDNKILYSCYYAFFINGVVALVFGAVMPYILQEFNMGYDKGGILLSMQSVGNLVASFIAGIIVVYLGIKKASVLLSSTTFIGFLLMIFTSNPIFLIVAFTLTGLGRGSISNISNTIVNDVSNGDSAKLNILHTFFAVGAFMIPFFASWCINKGYSWKVVMSVVAVMAGIVVLNFLTIKTEEIKITKSDKLEKKAGKKVDLSFLRNIDFYVAGGILFFYVGVEYAVNGWIVTYLKDTGLMSTSLAQKMLSVMWVIIIFGRLFTAYISKSIDKANILLASSIGAAVFFVSLLFLSNIKLIVFVVLGLGFCLAGIYPTTIASVGDILQKSSVAMGTLLSVAGVGGVIMPLVTGLVAEKVGIAGGMMVISVAVIFLFIFTLTNKLRAIRN